KVLIFRRATVKCIFRQVSQYFKPLLVFLPQSTHFSGVSNITPLLMIIIVIASVYYSWNYTTKAWFLEDTIP
ncbi:MAG: hypothetical protein NTX81_03110, partial [Candidatus Bathyarchaeota archaeon]|nr:hypothetical protein [Candidatus Bathyarchaeota archaeon]